MATNKYSTRRKHKNAAARSAGGSEAYASKRTLKRRQGFRDHQDS